MIIQKVGTRYGAGIRKLIPQYHRNNKFIQESCVKLSSLMDQPTAKVLELTKDSDMNRFAFLQKMVNKYNFDNKKNIRHNSENILNIYSMVKNPTPMHFNIVEKTKDSFESVEKMFNLAKDNESLEFIQNMQYDVLKDKQNSSQIIIDLLSSKNRDKYVNNTKDYKSFIKLHADNTDAVEKLDKLVDSGKYNRYRYDAQLAVKKLMKNKNIQVAMAGKTHNLEQTYSEGRGNFLKKIIKGFMPPKNNPTDKTKNTVVDMYNTLNSENTQLRYDIIDYFRYNRSVDKSAEIVEMKNLFDKIDKDEEAKKFVKKAISKDLKVGSIAELNEVLDTVPLKKANIFFNNTQRIIEQTNRDGRKTALIKEMENPFYRPEKSQRAKMVKLYDPYNSNEGLISKAAKYIENKINQFRFYHLAA